MEGTRAAGGGAFMQASRILEGSLPEQQPKGPDFFWRPTTTQNGARAGYQGQSPWLVSRGSRAQQRRIVTAQRAKHWTALIAARTIDQFLDSLGAGTPIRLRDVELVWRAKGEQILAKIQRAWKVALGENNTVTII